MRLQDSGRRRSVVVSRIAAVSHCPRSLVCGQSARGVGRMALTHFCPSFLGQRQWSRTGMRKHSVLPEPVPVVTMLFWGDWSFADNRHQARYWRTKGWNGALMSKGGSMPAGEGRNRRLSWTQGPLNRPASGSSMKRWKA